MKTLLIIKYRCLAIPAIWLDDSSSNVLLKRCQKNPEKRRALIHLYIKSSVMGWRDFLQIWEPYLGTFEEFGRLNGNICFQYDQFCWINFLMEEF